jgi:hypothetical protein
MIQIGLIKISNTFDFVFQLLLLFFFFHFKWIKTTSSSLCNDFCPLWQVQNFKLKNFPDIQDLKLLTY